jgi:hypothetical protein
VAAAPHRKFSAKRSLVKRHRRTRRCLRRDQLPVRDRYALPEFFTAPVDDTERAAILLHEAQHLRGGGEQAAFTHVWQARRRLGWTEEVYAGTAVWNSTIDSMLEYTPELLAH